MRLRIRWLHPSFQEDHTGKRSLGDLNQTNSAKMTVQALLRGKMGCEIFRPGAENVFTEKEKKCLTKYPPVCIMNHVAEVRGASDEGSGA